MRYGIIKVEASWTIKDEPMGSKEKFWVRRPVDDQPWLFKFSRVNNGVATGEHWAEKLAAEFARLLGIPHARVELATFDDRLGCLSRSFEELNDPQVELVHGNELLAGIIEGYDQQQHWGQHQHTLVNILRAVNEHIAKEQQAQAFTTICGFIVLDALILNTDRHHENWAMVRNSANERAMQYHIAPTFDHASSLGRELEPSRLSAWQSDSEQVARYANKGRGGVFWLESGRHGENPLMLAQKARRRWPSYFDTWLDTLKGSGLQVFIDEIHKVPDGCMSALSKKFVASLVEYSYGRLSKL